MPTLPTVFNNTTINSSSIDSGGHIDNWILRGQKRESNNLKGISTTVERCISPFLIPSPLSAFHSFSKDLAADVPKGGVHDDDGTNDQFLGEKMKDARCDRRLTLKDETMMSVKHKKYEIREVGTLPLAHWFLISDVTSWRNTAEIQGRQPTRAGNSPATAEQRSDGHNLGHLCH